MLYFATAIGLVFFGITFVYTLFDSELSWRARIGTASLIGGIATLASVALFIRDDSSFRKIRRRIRDRLRQRNVIPDSAFSAEFPAAQRTLALEVRNAIAEFFDVPSTRIGHADKLNEQFDFDALQPELYFYILSKVARERFDVGSIPAPPPSVLDVNGLINFIDQPDQNGEQE